MSGWREDEAREEGILRGEELAWQAEEEALRDDPEGAEAAARDMVWPRGSDDLLP